MNNIRRYNRYFLNEAVERTIDKKLWASVSSGISRTYRQDMGASAKPLGTRDQLLQKYIAALVQLKQPCPSTVDELRNSPAFPQWGKWLANNGVAIEEVQQLYNENCGKLPKAVIGNGSTAQPTNNNLFDNNDEEDDDDDLGFALGMTDDEYQEMKRQKTMNRQQRTQQPVVNNVPQTQVIDTDDDFDEEDEDDINQSSNYQDDNDEDWGDEDTDTDDIIENEIEDDDDDVLNDIDDEEDVDPEEDEEDTEDDEEDIEPKSSKISSQSTTSRKNLGSFTKKSSELKSKLFDGIIYSRDDFFKDLNGCQDPDDALTALTVNQLEAEGINNSDELVDLKALMRETSFCFVMRVYGEAGPIIENGEIVGLEGDVIWSNNPTDESYYVVAGDNRVAIFFKDNSGDLSEVYDASFEEFGFSD
jgi:hypothetical protein